VDECKPLPHGFYEDQMRAYFGQFGEVTRLRLSRNKKTGKSKHYAYVEFKHPEVGPGARDSHCLLILNWPGVVIQACATSAGIEIIGRAPYARVVFWLSKPCPIFGFRANSQITGGCRGCCPHPLDTMRSGASSHSRCISQA